MEKLRNPDLEFDNMLPSTSLSIWSKYDTGLGPELISMQALKSQSPPIALHDIEGRRQNGDLLLKKLNTMPLLQGVHRQTFKTVTADGHEMEMVWYSLASVATTPGPALVHAHGGGMIAFDVHSFHPTINNLVAASGVPVLSIDYRLAPEHPFPTPLEDCYTGLLWLRDHVKQLKVDPARIGVMGESAGGGLAAAMTLMARDRGFSPSLAKQILVYPMLDDRNIVTDSELLPFLSHTYDDNLTAWSAYVGKNIVGTGKVSKYAAPARETDLSNLPCAYIDVGSLDIFVREDIEYSKRLAAAQTRTEFHLYPGAPHGFEILVPMAELSKRAMENRVRAMQSF